MSAFPATVLGRVVLAHLALSGTNLMAVVATKGYFDDSRTDGQICTVAGFVGTFEQWEQFEVAWQHFLSRHEVPWLHMKEMGKASGHFKKWLPAADHRDELKSFFADAAQTINDCGFTAFGATIRLPDLERFNTERGLNLDAYSLGLYGCMVHIKLVWPANIVNLFLDRIEKVSSRIDNANRYAKADGYYTGVADFIQPIPLQECLTFRNASPIQAADFLAWELRKHHLAQNEWWEIEDKPSSWDDRFKHYREWSLGKFGTRLPPPRKSLNALLSTIKLEGIIWDYRALNIAHEARGGRWA